ncbi:hypothetical protein HHI36_014950 [Cryptolaemus montrouzieri]|uniref:Uncharacterized protein n=1 Tax=Cryptolaemus montrouzieri TaxID=559131 RepID=A0ABD2N434_9CUCU
MMDFSKIPTSLPDESFELEDKSFVKQFLDAEGKIWDPNTFLKNHENNEQTNNHFIDFPKIEPYQSEEYIKEEEIDIGENKQVYQKLKPNYWKKKMKLFYENILSIVLLKIY